MKTASLQPSFQERLLHGSDRHRDHVDHDPGIMASIDVVREVETGSMAIFRSTPISKLEFLTGKQVPYVVVAMLTFVTCC